MQATKIRVGMCVRADLDEDGQLEMVSSRERIGDLVRLYIAPTTYYAVKADTDVPVFNISGEEL